MNQAERFEDVLKKVKAQKKAENQTKDYDGLKVVDLFNGITAGAVAKLNVLTEMIETASGLPHDAPEDFIKYEAARLEAILRNQVDGICDCLLAVIACKDPEIKEAC